MLGLALYVTAGQTFAQTSPASTTTVTVPRLMTLNGTLRLRNGAPVNGITGVMFALYRDPEGGAPLWTEIQNVHAGEQGRYSVILGATQGAGLPLDLFSSNEPRWLGVHVQAAGEEEQPRVLLVSVPYALKAGDADTIGGRPASAFVMVESAAAADGGQSGSSAALITVTDGTAIFAASGAGTANRLAKWMDNSGTMGDSILTDDGSKTGLHNAAPEVTLDVSGTIRSVLGPGAPFGTYLMPTGGAGNSYRFGLGNNFYFDGTNWRTKGDGANNAGSGFLTDIGVGAMTVFALPSTGGADQVIPDANLNNFERMRIQGDGKVGIGTSTPATALDVSGTIRSVFGPGAPFGTYLMPTGGEANAFRLGFGNNLYFDGANWRTKGDGANNAGSAILTDIGAGNLSIYTLPSTGARTRLWRIRLSTASKKCASRRRAMWGLERPCRRQSWMWRATLKSAARSLAV